MADMTAQAYLDQESNSIAKVSRAGAAALRTEAKVLSEVYRDRFDTMVASLGTNGKGALDTTMDFLEAMTARINDLHKELKDPAALPNPRLHMRADRVFRNFEIQLADEYRLQAAELNIKFDEAMRREIQSGLTPTSTALAYHGDVIDPDIEAAQARFNAQIDEWLTTVPTELIEITNKDLPLGFDFSEFEDAQEAKKPQPLRTQVQDVTDIDMATGKPVDSKIFAAIEAATSPFPTLNRDEPQVAAYVSPTIQLAPPKPVAAPAVDVWAPEVLAKAAARIEERITTAKKLNVSAYIKDVLVPLQNDTLKELVARREAGAPASEVNHILDYADFLRSQTQALKAQLAAKEAEHAQNMQAVQPELDKATIAARAKLAEIKVEPAPQGWLARAKGFFSAKPAVPAVIESPAPVAAPVYAAPAQPSTGRVDVWNSQNLMTASLNILKDAPKVAGPELAAFIESNLKKAQGAVAAELERRGDTARTNPNTNSNLYVFADFVNDQLRQAEAKIAAAAPQPQVAAEPERKTFFSRMKDAGTAGLKLLGGAKDRLVDLIPAPVQRLATNPAAVLAGVGTAAVLGVGGAIIHDAPSITGLAKSANAVPENANPRFARGVVTYPSAVAEPEARTPQIQVIETKDIAAPAAVAPAALPEAKAPHVKKAFTVQSNEPYKMPESLKVTFNDGTVSVSDKPTWIKACDTVEAETGTRGEFCQGLTLNHS